MPVLALAALTLAGAASAGPALLAMAGTSAAGAGLALLWARDLGRVASVLRYAAGGSAEAAGPAAAAAAAADAARATRLPLLADLSREGQSLLRGLARRIEEAERLRRTDESIIEALADPLIVLGADLRLRRANPAAVREFGPEAAAILRHPVLRAAIDRALAVGAPQSTELSLPVPMPREVRATVSLLPPAGAGGDRIVVLLADRTREHAVERMRADFVANAGHELRTPLTGLIGFIETLRGPAADDPAAQRRFLGIMAEQASRMQRLIDDLLSLSRIELVEHRRPAGQVDVAELAAQVADGFEPSVLTQAATLTLEIDPALPRVAGDADQLAQVLQNLLDNALKHGGKGVRVRLIGGPARPGERWPVSPPGVVLVVEDTGPGIAQEHLPRLTERFYRVDAGRSRASGGTGLGLAIVKHIINRHRGQLRVESTEGAGSRFSIWLPAVAPSPSPAPLP